MLSKKKFGQEGQTLLIVVLVMVVGLTIGLSVVSRSITNLRTTKEEASSAEALAAAEAGVQQSLQTGNDSTANAPFNNKSVFESKVSQATITDMTLNGGQVLNTGEGVDLWLIGRNADGTMNNAARWSGALDIYWGESTDDTGCSDSALEVLLIRGNMTTQSYATSRYVVDPCSSRRAKNHYDLPSNMLSGGSRLAPAVVGGKPFYYRLDIDEMISVSPADGILVRIVPVYKNANVGASGIGVPTQGSVVISRGTSSNVQRKLSVFQPYDLLPSEFILSGLTVPKSK